MPGFRRMLLHARTRMIAHDGRSLLSARGFLDVLDRTPVFLTEGSVYERLRRHEGLAFDPLVAHASLVYDDASARVLEEVHREYVAIATRTGLPMLALTDTWRANSKRLALSPFSDRRVNADNVCFIRSLLEKTNVLLGGAVGPLGDAYRPEEAPRREDA